jgi:hypothetical protein
MAEKTAWSLVAPTKSRWCRLRSLFLIPACRSLFSRWHRHSVSACQPGVSPSQRSVRSPPGKNQAAASRRTTSAPRMALRLRVIFSTGQFHQAMTRQNIPGNAGRITSTKTPRLLLSGAFEFFQAGYSAGDGFFLNSPARLSQSSILAPWRFMMMPCCRIDRKLFQAQ